MSTPAIERRFGPYGGRYVPETLIPALDELERAWLEARGDPAFQDELAALLRDFVGRPSPLYRAGRLSDLTGGEVYLKREDLVHTGAHKINGGRHSAGCWRGAWAKTRVWIAETDRAGPDARGYRHRACAVDLS